jgi:ribosome-binding factor A
VGIRLLRINESIRETLSTVIAAEGLKDPRVGFVTVTGVETTPDLRHAKVFVSVLGREAQREATMAALEKAHGYLQARLNEQLRMKRTPQLQFVYDATLDNAMHIDKLLKQEEALLGSEPPEIVVGGEEPGVGMSGDDQGAPAAGVADGPGVAGEDGA